MNEIYSQPWVIGIDAGGTRTRALLMAAGGGDSDSAAAAVLGRGTGGPGNALSVGRADLTAHLTDAVGQALRAVPEGVRGRVAAAYGGFAGAAPGLGEERGHGLALSCVRDALAAHGITGAAVGVGGDTEIALASAPGAPVDGLVLIAGTGAIATRLTGRRRAAAVDGHGWLLGDEGSGFWLGNRAVRAALEALDRRGPWTGLVDTVAAHYLGAGAPAVGPLSDADTRADLAEAVVTHACTQVPVRLALISPLVVTAAGEGDEVALRLLDEAAGLLADSVRALRPHPGEPLVATGGLLGPGGPLLARVTDRLAALDLRIFPVRDGAAGAAALARRLLL